MLYKDPKTLVVLKPSDLKYFMRLKSASIFLDEDWFAENVDLEKIKMLTVDLLNEDMGKLLPNRVLHNREYHIKSCDIHDYILTVYLTGDNQLMINMNFDVTLLIQKTFRTKKNNVKLKVDEFLHGRLKVESKLAHMNVVDTNIISISII